MATEVGMRLRARAVLFLFVVAPPVCSGLLAGMPWTAAAAMARGGPSLPWSVTATAVWLFWLLLLAGLLLELVTDGRQVLPGLESVQALAAGLIAGVRTPQALHVFTVPTDGVRYEPLIQPDAPAQDENKAEPRPVSGRRPDATVPESPPAGPPPFLAPPRRPASRSRSASTITRPARYPPALTRIAPQAAHTPVIPPHVLPSPLPAPRTGSGHGPSGPSQMPPRVAIGVDDDRQPVLADLAQIGLGVLSGPGAYGAIRALLAAALTCSVDIAGPSHRILITAADLATLDLTDLGPVPELTVTAGLHTALRHLSAEVLHRAWLASTVQDGTGPPRTLGELRSALPEEHLPTLLLVSTDPAAQGPALAALLSQGVAYGLGAILAAPHPSSGAVHVSEDGTLPATVTTLRRLTVLSASATTAVLRQVTAVDLVPEEETDGDTTIPLRAYLTSPPPLPAPVPPPTVETPAAAVPARAEPRTGRPVQLCLFGPPRILTHGDLVTHGLRARAIELMAYLALHPDGARTGTMIGELLPDASDDTRAKNLIYTVIGSVRELLRTRTGHDTTWFIQRTHSGYQLDDSLIDVDLWQVRAELATAAKTSDRTRRSSAVSAALEVTGGRRFLDQVPWEWADTHVLSVHHQLLEASRRLATDLADNDRTDQALTVLHDALAIDPYAEDLYQQLLRIHARRNDLPALHRAYQLLQTRLNDINAHPSRTTTNLYTALTHRPHPHP
ncbi:bacterial transcriptional activator domain-containing protein [Frankia sp. EAN1pec]|uniref:BTAD domain-containing putative transcriptional regulator n=1 Tax=Parafrankia sp. (strain EAN1pec) TaxID=298653 RepID=UPI0018DEC601